MLSSLESGALGPGSGFGVQVTMVAVRVLKVNHHDKVVKEFILLSVYPHDDGTVA